MGDIGLERLQDSAGKPRAARAGGTKSGTTTPASVIDDHELADLIAVWPSLTPEQRRTILAAAGIGALATR
jgi:hypothetical protein